MIDIKENKLEKDNMMKFLRKMGYKNDTGVQYRKEFSKKGITFCNTLLFLAGRDDHCVAYFEYYRNDNDKELDSYADTIGRDMSWRFAVKHKLTKYTNFVDYDGIYGYTVQVTMKFEQGKKNEQLIRDFWKMVNKFIRVTSKPRGVLKV